MELTERQQYLWSMITHLNAGVPESLLHSILNASQEVHDVNLYNFDEEGWSEELHQDVAAFLQEGYFSELSYEIEEGLESEVINHNLYCGDFYFARN